MHRGSDTAPGPGTNCPHTRKIGSQSVGRNHQHLLTFCRQVINTRCLPLPLLRSIFFCNDATGNLTAMPATCKKAERDFFVFLASDAARADGAIGAKLSTFRAWHCLRLRWAAPRQSSSNAWLCARLAPSFLLGKACKQSLPTLNRTSTLKTCYQIGRAHV